MAILNSEKPSREISEQAGNHEGRLVDIQALSPEQLKKIAEQKDNVSGNQKVGQTTQSDKENSTSNESVRKTAEAVAEIQTDAIQPHPAKTLEDILNGEIDINDPESIKNITEKYLGSNN